MTTIATALLYQFGRDTAIKQLDQLDQHSKGVIEGWTKNKLLYSSRPKLAKELARRIDETHRNANLPKP